jgi:putative flippase GtrA
VIIWILVSAWTAPLHLFVTIVRGVGIHLFSDGFYINNGAKAIATVASLIWNYIMYKKVVFKNGQN